MARRIAGLAFCLCCTLAPIPVRATPAAGVLRVEPSEIRAGILYHGAQVRVDCEAPRDAQIAVVLEGHREAVELKEKKRILGLVWMNVGEIRFENLPSVYKVATGGPEGGGLTETGMRLLGLSYDGLEQGAGITDEMDRGYFREYLKLKEREGLYEVMAGAISVRAGGDGCALGEVVFDLPAKASAGRYELRLFAISEHGCELLAEASVTVRQVGVAAYISDLAASHGLLYGVLAAVLAVLIGLLTGVVFGLGGKGGH